MTRPDRALAIVAGVVAALVVGGCDPKKELLEPQNPGIIGPDQVQSPTAADAFRKGVLGRLRSSTQSADGAWLNAGLLADEWKSSNTFSQHQEIDSRSMALNNSEIASIYSGFQAGRGAAYTALDVLNAYLPTPVYLGQMYFVMGFMELSLAQNFCNGIQVYGTENAFLDDITIDGNTIFGNGEIVSSPADNITIGGGVVAHRPVVTDNFVYFSRWGNGNDIDLGYADLGRGTADATVTGNHLINGVIKQNAGNTGTVMAGNTIYSSIFGWDTAEFPQNKYIWSHPESTVAFVRPNAYEPGRATIVAYSGSGAPFVAADLSGVLSPGDAWELRNARDFYGPAVASGIWDGNPIPLPMRNLAVAAPVGWPAPPPSDEFNVFVLLRPGSTPATSPAGSAPPPPPTTAPAPAPPPSPAPAPPSPASGSVPPNPADRKGPE